MFLGKAREVRVRRCEIDQNDATINGKSITSIWNQPI